MHVVNDQAKAKKKKRVPPCDIIKSDFPECACSREQKAFLGFLIPEKFADRAETLVGGNLTLISKSQFCDALGLFTSCLHDALLFSLRPPRG